MLIPGQSIADVGEATIAVGYLSGGLELALGVANALKLKMPGVAQWADFGRLLETGTDIWRGSSADGIDVNSIETIVGHKFARPGLLKEALVRMTSHSSPYWGVLICGCCLLCTTDSPIQPLREARVHRRCCPRVLFVTVILIFDLRCG